VIFYTAQQLSIFAPVLDKGGVTPRLVPGHYERLSTNCSSSVGQSSVSQSFDGRLHRQIRPPNAPCNLH
jgi:hypothetical protein